MRIAVDYRLVTMNPKSGMGVYVKEIVSTLRLIDKANVYKTFTFDFRSIKKPLISKLADLVKEHYFVNVMLPFLLRKKYDLLYSPNPPSPIFCPVPVVLTIPDLSFLHDTQMNFFVKLYLFFVYYLSVRRAQEITTFSENSKRDIVKFLKVNSEKVSIITPAVNKNFYKKLSQKKLKKVMEKFGINAKYILSVPGSFIERKNAKDLLLAYNLLPARFKKNYLLVFVGNASGPNFERFKQLVQKLKLGKRVIFTGYISEADLVALYQGAVISVFTSLYEGFGLPPLESMAAGTPVIVYKNSSLPEVVGNAGVLVENRDELTKSILNLLKNKKRRIRFARLGREKAKEFSWEKSAKKMRDLFSNLAS